MVPNLIRNHLTNYGSNKGFVLLIRNHLTDYETYMRFRFESTKPFSIYGTTKSSVGKLRNDFISTEPKIVPYRNAELKKFGTIPIFFTV